MKGYPVSYGYMGWIPSESRYKLFATESEYVEAYREEEE